MSNYIVGLTGGIGSGKTTVANLFAELGVPLVDADVIAREVVAPDTPGLAAIRARFGAEILTADGGLNRSRLREIIFARPEERQWLDALLHPLIRERMLASCQAQTAPYTLLVVPLLLENGLESMVNRVLVVDVSEATQLERTSRRDSVSREQVRAIMASQLTRSERRARADDLLVNEGLAPAALRQQVQQLHRRYLALASQQAGPKPLH